MSREAEFRAMELLKEVLNDSGAELLGAFRPQQDLLDDIQQDPAGGSLGCLPCLRPSLDEARLERMIITNELYVITSDAAYTVLDKDKIASHVEHAFGANTPQTERVAALPQVRRVLFSEMESCTKAKRKGINCIVVGSSSGPKSELVWMLSSDEASIMLESAHYHFMDAAMLATAPAGMLETRIAKE